MSTVDGKREVEDCNRLRTYVCEKPTSGYFCYHFPASNRSSADNAVNCTFPESLCYKHSNDTENDKQVIVQGCMSAEQCRRLEDKHLECCGGDLCNKG